MDEPHIIVKFIPQEDYGHNGKYYRNIEPKGDDTWAVSITEAEYLTDISISDFDDIDELSDVLDSTEGDMLKNSAGAPDWVKNHDGPFRIECDDIHNTPEMTMGAF